MKERREFMGFRINQLLDMPEIVLPFESTFGRNVVASNTENLLGSFWEISALQLCPDVLGSSPWNSAWGGVCSPGLLRGSHSTEVQSLCPVVP